MKHNTLESVFRANRVVTDLSVPEHAKYTCRECGEQFVIVADIGRRLQLIITEFAPDTCAECLQTEGHL